MNWLYSHVKLRFRWRWPDRHGCAAWGMLAPISAWFVTNFAKVCQDDVSVRRSCLSPTPKDSAIEDWELLLGLCFRPNRTYFLMGSRPKHVSLHRNTRIFRKILQLTQYRKISQMFMIWVCVISVGSQHVFRVWAVEDLLDEKRFWNARCMFSLSSTQIKRTLMIWR